MAFVNFYIADEFSDTFFPGFEFIHRTITASFVDDSRPLMFTLRDRHQPPVAYFERSFEKFGANYIFPVFWDSIVEYRIFIKITAVSQSPKLLMLTH